MPRINTVQKSRKDQGTCRCGKELNKGEPYIWWAFRYGGKVKRCLANRCRPRPSELTNAKYGAVLAAVEEIEDALEAYRDGEALDDLREIIESASQDMHDCGQEYRDSADSIRDQFADSPTADECDERADEIEAFADMVGGSASEFEDPEEFDGDVEDYAEHVIEIVQDALNNNPF